MSGIEVAGIALAVFPIIIDGISHFVNGVEKIKYWRRYRIKLQGYATAIEAQRVCYLDTLEGLFADIVESEEDLNILMSNPGGPAWQSPNYDARLHQRLDRSYNVYLSTLRDMVENLTTMCHKLGVDQRGKVQWDEYSVVDREMKRLKVTFLKDAYQVLIANIEKANNELRETTRQNIYLEPIRKTRRSKKITAALRLIRKHAVSLHHVFIAGKAWSCQCRNYHQASLRLEPRPQALQIESTEATSEHKFRILLSNAQPSQLSPATLEWQEIEVRPCCEEPAIIAFSKVISGGKGVRWALGSASRIATPVMPRTNPAVIPSAVAIADICSTIWRTPLTGQTIGFLTDEKDCEVKHFLYRANTLPADKPQSKSLNQILSEKRKDSPSGTLLKKERLEIAVILASSVLQLGGTSWLNSRWSSHDIYFHKKLGELSESLAHPYLSWKQCSIEEGLTAAGELLAIGNPMVREGNIYALGLALIELCFGRPLNNLRRPEDDDPNEAAANTKCAKRLLDFVYDEMDDVYRDVVRRCLFQPFDVRDMNLNIEEVQQQVYTSIVSPLVENLNNFKGMSRIK